MNSLGPFIGGDRHSSGRFSPLGEYRRLENINSPHRRGTAFESFLLRIFRAAGFLAELDTKIAEPRQTDIVASYGEQTYLVEAKWEKSPVSVEVVDAVEARLRRTAPGVVGVIVSMSGFSRTVSAEVISKRRDRAILLLDRNDIEALIDAPDNLSWVLRSKHNSLIREGKVNFRDPVELRETRFSWGRPVDDRSRLVDIDGNFLPWITTSHGRSSAAVFGKMGAAPIEDAKERGAAIIKLFPAVGTIDSVRRLLSDLHDSGKCDAGFRWTLAADSMSWSGVGKAHLFKILDLDVQGGGPTFAGAELVCYGQYRGADGFWGLSVDLYERESSNCDLSFCLAELPIDLTPYRHFVEVFGEWWEGRVSWDFGQDLKWGRVKPSVSVEVVGYVVRESPFGGSEPWVTGIIAKNPFRDHMPFGLEDSLYTRDLKRNDHIISDVTPHIPWRARKGFYDLDVWDFAFVGGASVFSFWANV
ncbi:restriction endonuclease [Streptomyces sp. PRh5]|uniref:restriction endonuclease n=1 Tax=Streptomyces sp. PRh5 TaxID=1158056 RepID=UPI0009989D45|nr:restriction endonuclease [Streptomyces sp. PRh5]